MSKSWGVRRDEGDPVVGLWQKVGRGFPLVPFARVVSHRRRVLFEKRAAGSTDRLFVDSKRKVLSKRARLNRGRYRPKVGQATVCLLLESS